MTEIKRGEKCYIEVEVDDEHNANSVYVWPPHHPTNEYSYIIVYKKHLISKEESMTDERILSPEECAKLAASVSTDSLCQHERVKRLESISKFADSLVYITMHEAEVALEEDGFPVRPAKYPFFSSCITREEANQIIINAMRTKHRYDH
jgi:hypothetical protein